MTKIFNPSPLHLAPLHSLAGVLDEKFKNRRITEEDLKTLGLALWKILPWDESSISSSWMIESASMEIQNLPWESLYHPRLGFLARHPEHIFSRRLFPPQFSAPLPKGPLRILLFLAQSKKHTIFPEFEQHLLRETLQTQAGRVQLYAPEDGRFSTLTHLLNFPWHVVLLAGHGFQTHSIQGEIQAFFAFEHQDIDHEIIAAPKLVQVFEKTSVQCVVVATCDSVPLAMYMAQRGVPHVVGMQGPLLDRAGSVFIQKFCLALAQQHSIGFAVQQGRYAMQFLLNDHETWVGNSDPSVGQWSLPVLLSQTPEQAVIDWNFYAPTFSSPWLGSQVKLPQLFIGRRRELCTLGEALRTGKIRWLWVRGKGGRGKTAFVGQLVKTLIELGYRVLIYQKKENLTFRKVVTQAFHLSFDLSQFIEQLTKERWILWLDQLDHVEEDVLECLKRLCYGQSEHLRLLVTSRNKIPHMEFFHDYDLAPPDYHDFSRYLEYLGLSYPEKMKRFIYDVLEGNFQGVQLLQSFPVHAEKLPKQLNIVKRYLQAYWRE